MIKSKAHKKYYGRKAYADGYYGRIREHAVIEDVDGMREEYSLDIGADGMMTAESVVVIEKLNFLSKNNVVVAIAVVDGRTYVGNAVLNPKDTYSENMLGRRLALARALQDADGEDYILDEVSDMNDPDGDDEPVAYCDCCGEPIYEEDDYQETADGYYACCDDCREALEESEFWEDEEEEVDPDGTENAEEHYI